MKIIFFLISVLLVIKVSSQEVKLDSDQLPTSIYTSSINKLPSINSLLPINEKEDLASFENISLNVETIKKEISSIFTENLGKKSTKFFNEEFQERAMKEQ
jgi:hypothetical protein